MIEAEGWYVDPFGRHQQRWFSAGQPTALVRDGNVDAHDEPPAPTWDGPLHEPAEVPRANETLRAGDAPEPEDLDEAGHYG